jgi:hypothetical protein
VDRIDTSHSVWLFDTDRMRFRRAPKGTDLDAPSIDRDWETYFGLEIDEESGAFTVVLNEDGTRLLRSWREASPEPRTPPDATTELSVEVLRNR